MRVGPDTVVGARSVVDSQSVVGSHCTFEPDCYVGENVRVGVDVRIAAGATVGDGAVRHPPSERAVSCPPLTLGDGVRIGPGVAVAPGAAVGHGTHVDQDTAIGPSARLGSFVRVASGVRVAPNAEVGDRSTLAPGCAVDGLVGRNCRLGRDVEVAAGARVADGVQLGAGERVRADTPACGSLASLTAPSAPQVTLRASDRPRTVLPFWLRSVPRALDPAARRRCRSSAAGILRYSLTETKLADSSSRLSRIVSAASLRWNQNRSRSACRSDRIPGTPYSLRMSWTAQTWGANRTSARARVRPAIGLHEGDGLVPPSGIGRHRFGSERRPGSKAGRNRSGGRKSTTGSSPSRNRIRTL